MCQKCGCNTCEIEIRGPLLTEGKIKGLISNNLQYHIDKNIPLMENVFRIGSDAHLSMIKEARKLYTRNALDLCEDDKALMETHIGEFDLFENEIVPLDLPMLNEVEIGDKVKIDKTYGGGKGEITNKMGSFIVVNGSSYHESDVELLDEKLKGLDGKACWKGYKLSGTKKKGGKTVDNCVPMEESVPGMHSTFEDYIDELEKTMYVDRRDGGKIFIHPLDKPGVRRPSKDYISISGNNITAVQGYNSGPIQDLADAYSSLSVDKDSRLVPMGKDYASGKASLLSSNILVDAIKAIKASRDAEAKNQQTYYRKRGPVSGVGNMDEEVTKPEEKKLKKIKKELEGASKMHAGQAKKIAKIVKEKLTKGSSVEDHVEDFKDSDAPQFKGKSKDKKVQMAVAAYLSKKNK